jgi:hypothetical protein
MRRLAQSILFTTRESSVSTDAEQAKRPAELNEGQPEKQGENSASSDSRPFEDPEDGVGKVEAA